MARMSRENSVFSGLSSAEAEKKVSKAWRKHPIT